MVEQFDDDGDLVTHDLGTDTDQGFVTTPYAKPIPFPVLEVMARIRNTFGDRVGLFISDYAEVKPDPFLMVTARGLPAYVIERWDEPAFRP